MTRHHRGRISRLVALSIALACALAALPASAEHIKIGVIHVMASGPVFLAQDKGYFAAEGLDAEIVFFGAAQNVALATVAGDVDFDLAGLVAAAYNLAGQSELRLIAGGSREAPGYQGNAYLVANRAYAAGLRRFQDFPGHSFAVATIGSPGHYVLAQLFQKYNLDLATMRIVVMQGLPNEVTALIGGQVDAANLPSNLAAPVIARGAVTLLGYVGDETPWQLAGVFVSAKTADTRGDVVMRFLRAYRRGTRDFHDAFSGPDDKPQDGPTAAAVRDTIAKYLDQSPAALGSSYIDRDARLDVNDVLRQIAWYKSQNFIKLDTDGAKIIDQRYAVPLPEK
jgi:NitT/TauT family transport system substrate-binding protein